MQFFNFAWLQSETMVADNNTLTLEQMAARIAELEYRLAKKHAASIAERRRGPGRLIRGAA